MIFERCVPFQRGQKITPREAMGMAVQEALHGAGFVLTNPMVGCVIVDRDHKFISSGYHQFYGGDHAEIDAIKNSGGYDLTGATFYVTLEPCSHQGKTPPCANRLSGLGIKKVVYGDIDPNPKVSGKGLEILQNAGIEVEKCLELRDELDLLNESFFKSQSSDLPFVAIKVASTLDGRFATRGNKSQWITNSQSREVAHFLRQMYDATLVGVGTVLEDNPSLNIRLDKAETKENKVVIIDPSLKMLKRQDLRVFKMNKPENIIVVHDSIISVSSEVPFTALPIPSDDGEFQFKRILLELKKLNINSVLVEGGGRTISKVLSQNAANRLHLFIAPFLMGPGRTWTDEVEGIRPLDDKIKVNRILRRNLGGDIYITGTF